MNRITQLHLIGLNGKMGSIIQEQASPDFQMAQPENADVFLDFSSPEGTLHALKLAVQWNKPLVSGTTGLSSFHLEQLKEASKKIPILYSPNFSLGIATLFKIAEEIKDLPGARIEIHEEHHIHKKDAPSGTALKLKNLLNDAPITWERKGETVGIHEVIVHLEHETFSLRHVSHSRKAFAQGALHAAKLMLNKPPGFYQLKDIIHKKLEESGIG